MTLPEKSRQWEEDYGLLPDPQDRFQYLIDQSATAEGLPPEERVDAHRVAGCVSAVWLLAEEREGRVFFRSEGDSPVVKALAWMLGEFYSGAPAEEIVATPPTFVSRLGLDRALTENRRRGLQALIGRHQDLARSFMTEAPSHRQERFRDS